MHSTPWPRSFTRKPGARATSFPSLKSAFSSPPSAIPTTASRAFSSPAPTAKALPHPRSHPSSPPPASAPDFILRPISTAPMSASASTALQISDDDFAHRYFAVHETAERLVSSGELLQHPSFFETLTAMAFLQFADAAVDIAVLEVGLGGRLDATNIVQPLLSVITDISLDHTEWLGPTISAIAREKAGILRQNGTLITLPQHPEANHSIGEIATDLNVRAISATPFMPAANTAPYAPYSVHVLGATIQVASRSTALTSIATSPSPSPPRRTSPAGTTSPSPRSLFKPASALPIGPAAWRRSASAPPSGSSTSLTTPPAHGPSAPSLLAPSPPPPRFDCRRLPIGSPPATSWSSPACATSPCPSWPRSSFLSSIALSSRPSTVPAPPWNRSSPPPRPPAHPPRPPIPSPRLSS